MESEGDTIWASEAFRFPGAASGFYGMWSSNHAWGFFLDNIVHIAIFVAIPVHLARVHGSTNIWSPAITLMAGVLLSTFSVWWLILRRPEEERARRQRLYERIASRDFIYLVFVLAVIEHLDWFLWSAAIGANVFWLSLWVVL